MLTEISDRYDSFAPRELELQQYKKKRSVGLKTSDALCIIWPYLFCRPPPTLSFTLLSFSVWGFASLCCLSSLCLVSYSAKHCMLCIDTD